MNRLYSEYEAMVGDNIESGIKVEFNGELSQVEMFEKELKKVIEDLAGDYKIEDLKISIG